MGKSYAVLILFALAIVGCRGDGQTETSEISQSEADEQWRKQVADYDRQTAKMDKIIERQEFELEKSINHNDQYGKLLTKWEEQTRRADAILDAFEKKTGVKP